MYESEDISALEMDENFINENNKVVQHISNGFSRLLILWIIRYNKEIHGYGIMKELDTFFKQHIERGIMKKYQSGKVYPILKSYEKAEMITGEWKEEENKKVKYYRITEKGMMLLNFISKQHKSLMNNQPWALFLKDFYQIQEDEDNVITKL